MRARTRRIAGLEDEGVESTLHDVGVVVGGCARVESERPADRAADLALNHLPTGGRKDEDRSASRHTRGVLGRDECHGWLPPAGRTRKHEQPAPYEGVGVMLI